MADTYALYDALANRLQIPDGEDDDQLIAALDATAAWVESWTGRRFGQSTSTTRYFWLQKRNRMSVPIDDAVSVSAVALGDGITATYSDTLTVDDDYYLAPVNAAVELADARPYTHIQLVRRWTVTEYWQRPQVEVTGVWGWPAVPDPVAEATLIQASRLYKRRFSPDGVLGGAEGFGAVRVGTRLDPDVKLLLEPFRRSQLLIA